MFKTILLSLLILSSTALSAQILNPVHWKFSARGKGLEYEVHLSASLDPGWHIYSQVQPPEAVAIPTYVSFDQSPDMTLSGKPKEIGDKEKYDDQNSGIIQYQYENSMDLVQAVHLKTRQRTTLKGTINYQVCTDEKCLPPKTIPFTITIP